MGQSTQTFDILTRAAIGHGSLVYRAVEKTTQREVALKLLTCEHDLDHRMNVKALLAEAPRYKSIYGAHVCQMLDAYEDDDGPILVYEYADGRRGSEVPIESPLDADAAVDVAAQLMDALCSAEQQGVPHGDLKPSNLVLASLPDGRPYALVLNWALSAHRSMLGEDSLPYLAPERLTGGRASHAADLFSAGAVLFYLYTGKVLVPCASAERVAAAWKKVRPLLLAELRPDLPPALVQWVAKLLELKPSRRPASAEAARAALETLHPPADPEPPESMRREARIEESSAASPEPDEPECSDVRSDHVPPLKRKRGRWPSFLAGVFGAVALASGGFYYFQASGSPAAEPLAKESKESKGSGSRRKPVVGDPAAFQKYLSSLEAPPIAAGPEEAKNPAGRVLISTKASKEKEKAGHRTEKVRH